jgi:hypothetical protein
MPCIEYVQKRFNRKATAMIENANKIIAEYSAAGFVLTLRQLYYQFVARELIPNNLKSYKTLGVTINNARLAGRVDWNAIEDRTRNLRGKSHWADPGEVIQLAADGYSLDLWESQPHQAEVWIEKDALTGVIERVCDQYDVPYFSCRGYTSQSELWRAAMRHIDYAKPVVVIHLGDHDPSGIDMTRDIEDRLALFGAETEIQRIALNMDQVKKYKLPPNPAKASDSRFKEYKKTHGIRCWELDALDPKRIETMLESRIKALLVKKLWEAKVADQELDRSLLLKCSDHWNSVEKFLAKKK